MCIAILEVAKVVLVPPHKERMCHADVGDKRPGAGRLLTDTPDLGATVQPGRLVIQAQRHSAATETPLFPPRQRRRLTTSRTCTLRPTPPGAPSLGGASGGMMGAMLTPRDGSGAPV